MKHILSAIALTALISACATNGIPDGEPQAFDYSASPREVGVSPRELAEMNSLLQSFVDDKRASSLAAFVAKNGKVVYADAFGWKDVENQVPASFDDYYVLFSQTKAITTVAFMTLVEKGLVDIHDPVAQYFPDIPDEVLVKINDDGSYKTRPVKTPMTFVHLMSHTSGLDAGLAGEARRRNSGGGGPMGFDGKEVEVQPSGQHTGGGNW